MPFMPNIIMNSQQKKCRKAKSFYPSFKPLLASLSVTTSKSGIYTLVYVNGANFLPNGNTYINFGSITNIPINYYSSNYISFVVPILNNLEDTIYNVFAVNIYNGNFGEALKHPTDGSLVHSNSLPFTLITNQQIPPPPDFGYGPFIYPYDLTGANPESIEEANTFEYALTAYYNETVAVIYLNDEITLLNDIITQANAAKKALLAIQIAQEKITQAINLNVSANLYQNNLISAQQQYNTAIQKANDDILYSQNITSYAVSSLTITEQNIFAANNSANLAYQYAVANPARPYALITKDDANFLAANVGGNLTTNIQTFLLNGLLELIKTQINQYNTSADAINTVNLYINNIKLLINYITLVEGWTNTVVIDASTAIIPLATRT